MPIIIKDGKNKVQLNSNSNPEGDLETRRWLDNLIVQTTKDGKTGIYFMFNLESLKQPNPKYIVNGKLCDFVLPENPNWREEARKYLDSLIDNPRKDAERFIPFEISGEVQGVISLRRSGSGSHIGDEASVLRAIKDDEEFNPSTLEYYVTAYRIDRLRQVLRSAGYYIHKEE